MTIIKGSFGVLLSTLVACGGGGGSSSGASPSPTVTPTPAASPSPTPSPVSFATEYLSGGLASVDRDDVDAFSQSPAAIESDFSADAVFKQGNLLFRGELNDVGPILNNSTCQGCHVKDGRGNPPANTEEVFTSMLLKLSLGNDENDDPIPDPIYGTQFQSLGLNDVGALQQSAHAAALDGTTVTGEAFAFIQYEEIVGSYTDGTPYTLQQPTYYLSDAAWGDFADGLLISPRVASSMIGLGLLGAIDEEDILALADPNDGDGDGISGRARFVYDQTTDSMALGRYGWKSSTASVLQQNSDAFRGDLGLTNRFAVEEGCTPLQISCLASAENELRVGDSVDADDIVLASVEFYSRLLAVPQRRGFDVGTETWDADIVAGTTLFNEAGCADCHVRYFQTGDADPSVLGVVTNLVFLEPSDEPIAVLSQQDIWPHTDLLLHDMGGSCEAVSRETIDGEACDTGESCLWVFRCSGLADGRPDGTATGTEWRTAPLWGLGLTKTVNPDAGFLHDGRARTIEEAILWHGGEASESREVFINMSADERAQMLVFLNSL